MMFVRRDCCHFTFHQKLSPTNTRKGDTMNELVALLFKKKRTLASSVLYAGRAHTLFKNKPKPKNRRSDEENTM